VSLELGGKSPFIICEDAEIDQVGVVVVVVVVVVVAAVVIAGGG